MNSKLININVNQNNVEVLVVKKSIKSLRLKIDSKGKVSLNIPSFYPYYKANEFLISKIDWIEKALNNVKTNNMDYACNFKNNSTICLWGKIVNISIFEYKKDKIELNDTNLIIYTKQNNYDYIYKKFILWAKKEFIKMATTIYNHEFNKHFNQYGLQKPKLLVRAMKSMWGNCKYNKGEITLNLYLLKAPLICLQYVILHELSHLMFHDHSIKFKNFLTELMPSWKECKNMLKNYSLNF